MPQIVRHTRRVVVAVIGGSVLLLGVVMMVAPGPAMVVIPVGLAILATEFVWARHVLRRVRAEAERATRRFRGSSASDSIPTVPPPDDPAAVPDPTLGAQEKRAQVKDPDAVPEKDEDQPPTALR